MNYIFSRKIKKILVTGGLGFIGGAYITRLLRDTNIKIFNLDKYGYASDESNIRAIILKEKKFENYKYFNVNLENIDLLKKVVYEVKPDLIVHFAAETHVDRSIDNPKQFLESNIIGTFNLLQVTLSYYEKLNPEDKSSFRFHHISTDEVFGSLGSEGFFNEKTSYDPTSPYSASKASSDHLVNAWFHTYGLPILISNCSNNFGPWQFPEKLIPLVILKAISGQSIPIYGTGQNVRDWLFIEDHINALILISDKGIPGEKYCIGGYGETTNIDLVKKICSMMDKVLPKKYKYSSLINFVMDRPGHDKRYAIDSSKISRDLGWVSKYSLEKGLKITLEWYLKNYDWCNSIMTKSGYSGERIGIKFK